MKKKIILWDILFIIYLIILIYFATTPKPPFNYSKFYGEDKIWHFLAYAGGMFLFLKSYFHRKFFLYFFGSIIFILPIGSEYIQALSPYRYFSLYDALASYAGILAVIITLIIHKKFLIKDKT
jgi:VanZ family protein